MTTLVTLADYKTYKKLTKTENDSELEFIINSVSALVKNYCGHSFIDYYSTPKVEIFNIKNTQYAILLNEWPIKEVVSVQVRDNYQADYSVLNPPEYYVDTSIDTIFRQTGYWEEGFGAVKVTYTAGYQNTPDDLKIACLDLVAHYFKEEYKERKSIGAISIDIGSKTTWPSHVTRVLDLYRNG